MPDLIKFSPVDQKSLCQFHDFDCGDAEWEVEVADWITGRSDDCAAKDLREKRCKIFAYSNQANEIVGFGAIGKTNGNWPDGNEPPAKVAIIPWMGIYKRFQGMPKGDGEIRYSDQIVADLVHKVKTYDRPYLVLFVHPLNVGAINVYRRNSFHTSCGMTYHDCDNPEKPDYLGMWFDLEAFDPSAN